MANPKQTIQAENLNNQPAENQDSSNDSTEKKETKKQKTDEEKFAKAMCNFMLNSNPSELEALRSVIVTIHSNTTPKNEDKDSINRFLYYGMNNGYTNRDMLVAHRIKRNGQLMHSVSRFLNKEQTVTASVLLSVIATDMESIEEYIKGLTEKNRSYGTSTKTPNAVNPNPQG